MAVILWLAGSAVVLTVVGALLSHRFGRGAFEDSFENPLNEHQTALPWKIFPP
jgi:hypothetical protein